MMLVNRTVLKSEQVQPMLLCHQENVQLPVEQEKIGFKQNYSFLITILNTFFKWLFAISLFC